jgi:uncharacterized membrane protein HdeD (DUF308 family)
MEKVYCSTYTPESIKKSRSLFGHSDPEDHSMNETSVSSSAKVIGIVTIILGIIALATPLVVGESVLLIIGFAITLAGVLRMVWAFQAQTLGSGIWKFLLGVLTLVAGLFVIAHPMMASGVLTIILAIYLFMDGLVEILVAFAMTKVEGKGWLLLGGFLSIALACLLFFQAPLSGAVAIGVLLGIKLIFAGITALALGTTLHSMVKAQQ